MAELVFTSNDVREFQPDLAARLEVEVREAVEGAAEEGTLQCRITERRGGERSMVAVQIDGHGWMVSFSVSAPPAVGEIRMETRKALRDRARRVPNYRRSKRR